jgi:hypothetical protein|tara:strand:- start:313 stop:876 length:564 start_codon:yes stop_codon:yes gene_type:complete
MSNEILNIQLRFWSSSTRDFAIKALGKLTSVTAKETIVEAVGDSDITIKPKEGKKLFLQTDSAFIGPMAHTIPILSTDEESAFVFDGLDEVHGLLIPKIVEVQEANSYARVKDVKDAVASLDPQKAYRLYGNIKAKIAKLWIENEDGSKEIAYSIDLEIDSKMDVVTLADRIMHASRGLVLSCDIEY